MKKLSRQYFFWVGIFCFLVRCSLSPVSESQDDGGTSSEVIALKGIVIKADEIKPKIDIATFTCDSCGS